MGAASSRRLSGPTMPGRDAPPHDPARRCRLDRPRRDARARRRDGEPLAETAGAQHRAPGWRGRVPLQHAVCLPEGGPRRRRHARARRRRHERRPARGHARHQRRPHDRRDGTDLREDLAGDPGTRRRVLVHARRVEPLQPRPRARRVPVPRRRDRRAPPAQGVEAVRLPCPDTALGAPGLPEDTDQHRDQGTHQGRGHLRVRLQRRGPRPGARRTRTATT